MNACMITSSNSTSVSQKNGFTYFRGIAIIKSNNYSLKIVNFCMQFTLLVLVKVTAL